MRNLVRVMAKYIVYLFSRRLQNHLNIYYIAENVKYYLVGKSIAHTIPPEDTESL